METISTPTNQQAQARNKALDQYPSWEEYRERFNTLYAPYLPHYEWCKDCEITWDSDEGTIESYTIHHRGTITIRAYGEDWKNTVTAVGYVNALEWETKPTLDYWDGTPASVVQEAYQQLGDLHARTSDRLEISFAQYVANKTATLIQAYTYDGGVIEEQKKQLAERYKEIEDARQQYMTLKTEVVERCDQMQALGNQITRLERKCWELILATHETRFNSLQDGWETLARGIVLGKVEA